MTNPPRRPRNTCSISDSRTSRIYFGFSCNVFVFRLFPDCFCVKSMHVCTSLPLALYRSDQYAYANAHSYLISSATLDLVLLITREDLHCISVSEYFPLGSSDCQKYGMIHQDTGCAVISGYTFAVSETRDEIYPRGKHIRR